jgi:hypothetical protein
MRSALFAAATIMLGGCGSPDSSTTNNFITAQPEEAVSPTPVETVDVQVPPCSSEQNRSANTPEISGVWLGMAAEEAFSVISCSNPDLVMEYQNGPDEVPRLPDGTKPRGKIVGQSPDTTERVEAILVGAPNKEVVVAVYKFRSFRQGEAPTMKAVEERLTSKYGHLVNLWYGPSSNPKIGWIRDAPKIEPFRCLPSVIIYGSTNVFQGSASSECGLLFAALIDRSSDNPGLIASVSTVITNGRYESRLVQAYMAYAEKAAREQAASEVQQAEGRTPDL